MKTIPLFGTGVLSQSAVVSAQRRVNCYYEIRQDGDKANIVIYGTPGTAFAFTIANATVISGMHVVVGTPGATGAVSPSILFLIAGTALYKVYYNAGTWVVSNVASFPKAPVSIASMSDNGTQLFIVGITQGIGTTSGSYIYNIPNNTLNPVNVGNQSGASNVGSFTGTFLDGYFFADGQLGGGVPGQFYMSNYGDGTAWSALNFGITQSNPDYIVAIDSDHGYLIIFGQYSIEFWQNTGSAGFPYAPIKSSTSQIGLAARFSRCKFDNTIAFLGTDTSGQVRVYELQSYLPVAISSPDVEEIINSMSVYSDAVAFSYRINGHQFYQITFPTGNRSFLYDNSTQMWSEVQSGTGTNQRHVAQLGASYIYQPVSNTDVVGESVALVTDSTNASIGGVYALTWGLNTDAIGTSTHILRLAQSRHVFEDGNQLAIDELYLNMELGTIPTGTANISMQVSKDNGNTFGTAYPTTLSVPGQYSGPRVIWRRIGAARDFVFRFFTTDPVNWVITYGAAVTRSLGR